MPTILLIEDHQDIAELVGNCLEAAGYVVDYAVDGVTGLHLAVSQDFDAIVLDLMLPGMDGLDVCKHLREEAGKDTTVTTDRLPPKTGVWWYAMAGSVGPCGYARLEVSWPRAAARRWCCFRTTRGAGRWRGAWPACSALPVRLAVVG